MLSIVPFLGLAIYSCQPRVNNNISSNIQAHIDLANSFLGKNEPRRSLKKLLPIKDKARGIPKYHFTLGLTYLQMQKVDKSILHFQKAVELKPDNGKAWNNLGRAYIAKGKSDKAKHAYKKALEIETYMTPEYPAYNLARLYRQEAEYEQALKYAQISTQKNWRYVPAYLLMANIYQKEDKLQKAKQCLEKGAEANPKAVNILLELAKSHLRLGNKKNAKYWFNKIPKIDPNSHAAQVASDYLASFPNKKQ